MNRTKRVVLSRRCVWGAPVAQNGQDGIQGHLENNVGNVLGTNRATLQHGKPALHEEDEESRGQDPSGVHARSVACHNISEGRQLVI